MTSQEPTPRPTVSEHGSAAPAKVATAEALSAVAGLKSEQASSYTSVDNMSESSEDVIMKEKLLPKVKQVSKCSYCQVNSAESLKTVPCLECGSRCHIDCIESTARFRDKILLGDDFFHFKCAKCTDGSERFKRYHLSWVDVVHITLFNLTHSAPARPGGAQDPTGQFSSSEHGPQEYGDGRIYFHYKADVARFIDRHWNYFWTKARGETWINSASSALSTNSTENVPEDGRFESGKAKYNKNGMWALTDDLRFPSSYDSLQQQKTRTIMYSFADDGSLIELRTQTANSRRKRRTEQPTQRAVGRSKKPRASDAQPYGAGAGGAAASKRTGRGKQEPKSDWAISMWPDIDNPQGPAHISREETHSAPQFVIGSDRLTVWNDKGYRMAKASHGVETGAWYFEADILDPVRPEFNVRIGWSQISGELQAPCGCDVFSYSMRAKPSTRFHAARGSFYGEDFEPGDTLGVLIYLPPLDADERQDLNDRKWHPAERYRQFTYSRPAAQRPPYANSELPPLPVLAGSELVYFKNGKCLGPAFQKLYLGKYYPAISAYMGGKVKVNLGPNFKHPPPATWHENTPIRPITDLEFTLPPPADSDASAQPAASAAGAALSAPVADSQLAPSDALPQTQEQRPEAGTTNGNAAPHGTEEVLTEPVKEANPFEPAKETGSSEPVEEVAASEPTEDAVASEAAMSEEAPHPVQESEHPVVDDATADIQDVVMESVETSSLPTHQTPPEPALAPAPAPALEDTLQSNPDDTAAASSLHSATPPVSQMETTKITAEKDDHEDGGATSSSL
ncbi:transcription factor, contains a PHD finger motif [Coemansia sp. RSA 1939]|nr:transcription factor, contains a PHD finger motif [Coemansia sp. RSA 1939]KAJ2597621.1 transcription factor, contains a PHD finger motif [Coemansia sp. RSA 1804]KAJ2687243.1 transcription factor, contains a PHD finger motif [Coemansia sp. RSA 1285]